MNAPIGRAARDGVTDPAKAFDAKVDTNRFRRARFGWLLSHIEQNLAGRDVIRIADIGGVIPFWQGVRDMWQHLPLDITIINIGAAPSDDPPFHIRGGDACDLSDFADNSFDLVHSNSVIEHVGHWPEMMAMAREVRRLAPHYFVQTPNFWFPMEPHFRTLFYHWYPEAVRANMLMRRKRGFRSRQETLSRAMDNVQSVDLLTAGQMRELFPDARLVREKFMLLTKSLIAIR